MATEHPSAPNEQSSNQSWFLRLQRESWYMEMITSAFDIAMWGIVPGSNLSRNLLHQFTPGWPNLKILKCRVGDSLLPHFMKHLTF